MTKNIIFDLYSNYLFIPIYFLIGLFFQINKFYSDKIDKFYFDDEEYDKNDEKNLYNFAIIDNKHNFYNLEKNKNIFIKKYTIVDTEQKQEYMNILTLRENILFAVDYYKPLHFMYLDYYLKNRSELFTLYKININTNDIIIDMSLNNYNYFIKEFIKNNYTKIINVLEYNNKYDKKDFNDWTHLYNQWIKPIEPSNKDNYFKLIQIGQCQEHDKKQIEVNEFEFTYTQIYCIRNFIQKEFFDNLQELYRCEYGYDDSTFSKLSYSLTIYRINNNNKNIITILY